MMYFHSNTVIKNGKIVWKHGGPYGCRTGNTLKQRKIAAFSEEFLSENGFEAVLGTRWYYYYDAKISETVEKIAIEIFIATPMKKHI